MAFWSSEKLNEKQAELRLVTTIDADGQSHIAPHSAIVNGAFELSLGPEIFFTSDDCCKKGLAEGDHVSLPPGQFGLLLTEEFITIPENAIGFISIKASIKFRGLLNVSGFHVDSGFSGRLKFAVYNAGSQNIVLERKQRVFLLWLSDLDRPTQPYSGAHNGQKSITPEDVMRIQGEIASPGQLKKEIDGLKHEINNVRYILVMLCTIAAGILVRGCQSTPEQRTPLQQDTNAVLLSPVTNALTNAATTNSFSSTNVDAR